MRRFADAYFDGKNLGIRVVAYMDNDNVEVFDIYATGGSNGRMIGGLITTVTLDSHGHLVVKRGNVK